jgi:hypothetical protein
MKQRPFCDMRASMKTNVLLLRPKVGKVMQPTRNLPPDEFAYTPQYHDSYGVREIFQGWAELERPSTTSRIVAARHRAPQDFVATNRAAIRSGCVSAHDFRDFKKKHEILVKPEENYDAEEECFRSTQIRSMVHGISTPVSTDMKAVMTWQYGRDAIERGRQRQSLRHLPKAGDLKNRVNHGIKPTRASRGHTLKPAGPPTVADTFKISRFLAIKRYAIDDQP